MDYFGFFVDSELNALDLDAERKYEPFTPESSDPGTLLFSIES